MTPLDYYHEQLQKGAILKDTQQLIALQHFQRLFNELIIENKKRTSWASIFHFRQLIQGLYIWGGVGIGKTFLMDCFYHCLPFSQKLRLHFHAFMQSIHHALTQHQGKKDPLRIIAGEIATKIDVLCFDEFYVSDITDAMLLGRLIKALFEKGVCLVATSNTRPDDLYKNGLQRSQFIPAIELIKKNCDIVPISTEIDYRLRHLKEAGVFYTPLDEAANVSMEKSFAVLTLGKKIDESPLIIFDRPIPIKKRADDIVWFEFNELCHVPRSQKDYLEIARQFRIIFISNVPVIPANKKDTLCLFVSLIDVLYDARIKLIMSAAEPVGQLYNRGHTTLEFTRTHSRLLEMQSADYFINQED